MKTMDCGINVSPLKKRLERLKNRLSKVEDANKREKLVHIIQRLEFKQKIQILKASKNSPLTPEKRLEILATRLDFVKMMANNDISLKKQGNIEKRMKFVQDKITAREDKKKKQSNKEEKTTTTSDEHNNEKKSKVTLKDRLVNQRNLLEEEDDPAQRQMIANRIARIENRIEQKEEQHSKRVELQRKIRLLRKSSRGKKLSEEQRLELLSDRLELAKNCPSRRRQIEKRMEMLRANIASAADGITGVRVEPMEEENTNEEEKNIHSNGGENKQQEVRRPLQKRLANQKELLKTVQDPSRRAIIETRISRIEHRLANQRQRRISIDGPGNEKTRRRGSRISRLNVRLQRQRRLLAQVQEPRQRKRITIRIAQLEYMQEMCQDKKQATKENGSIPQCVFSNLQSQLERLIVNEKGELHGSNLVRKEGEEEKNLKQVKGTNEETAIAPVLDMVQEGNNGEVENNKDDVMENCNDFELIKTDICKSTRNVEVDDSVEVKGYLFLVRKEEKDLKHSEGTREEMVTASALNKNQQGNNGEVESSRDDAMENCDDSELI